MTNSTAERIKQHALQLFAQKGYFGTSLNEVASLVGIKKPSLYAHFKNKDDLYITILQELMDNFIERVTIESAELESSTTRALLYRFLTNMVDFWKDETLGLLYKRTLLFPEEKFRSSIHEQFLQTEIYTTEILSKIFTIGQHNGEMPPQPLEPLIDAYYCLIDGLFVQRFFYSSSEFDKKVEHAFNHFWLATEIGGR
ncbi:TetR/AcrR family transcriptional regulator [Bacillus sp. RO1]|uniref:TetR/AcrR family transcriptional regulator n=1 Tax=Bacillus sp. RO1 TaxID=2722703 RepID=UPI001456BC6F|nr:TetR/AcrR family transcriptional regulator [Bacillus sp. RO1]NLP49658.1 TetR/AcrR family transcriptional regulator [Bacillus sp. RO1]